VVQSCHPIVSLASTVSVEKRTGVRIFIAVWTIFSLWLLSRSSLSSVFSVFYVIKKKKNLGAAELGSLAQGSLWRLSKH
jgi:hypothetical protein